MKNFIPYLFFLTIVVSCKVSTDLSIDQVSSSGFLSSKKTFKVIEKTDASRDVAQLNRIFEKKLIENGFSLSEENPQLLVQSVIASVNFEKEVLISSGSTSPGGYGPAGSLGGSSYFGSSPIFQTFNESGQYGKVIFLIQDAKTSEVLWMGTGTGILTSNEILDFKGIKSALDQLIAGLK